MVSFVGAGIMGISFLMLVWNIWYSFKNSPRDIGSDPWNARGLEWATHTPIPAYNFAITPDVSDSTTEAFWDMKKNGTQLFKGDIEKIHMPNNSGGPFVMTVFFFIGGFSLIFSMWTLAIISLFGILGCMIHRSFEKDEGYYISTEEVKATEKKYEKRGAK